MLVEAKADVNVPQQVLVVQSSCLVSATFRLANVPSYLSKDGSTSLVNIIRSSRLEGKAKLHWVRKLLDSKADVNFKDKVKAAQAFLCGNIFESSRTLLLVGRDGAAPHSCGTRRS